MDHIKRLPPELLINIFTLIFAEFDTPGLDLPAPSRGYVGAYYHYHASKDCLKWLFTNLRLVCRGFDASVVHAYFSIFDLKLQLAPAPREIRVLDQSGMNRQFVSANARYLTMEPLLYASFYYEEMIEQIKVEIARCVKAVKVKVLLEEVHLELREFVEHDVGCVVREMRVDGRKAMELVFE